MIEVKALGDVHGRRSGREAPCAIGSIKGNIGHTEGAAGIAGLVKAALSLHHGVLPPSRFAQEPNPQLRLADHGLRLADEPTPLPGGVVRAGVSSFGIGGTNAHMVLASAPASATREAADAPPSRAILTVSSASRDGLGRAAVRLADDLAAAPADRFGQLAWSSNRVKASGRHRLAICAHDRDQARRRAARGRRRRNALERGGGRGPRDLRRVAVHRPGVAVPGYVARAARHLRPSTATPSARSTRRWRPTSAGRSASCCSPPTRTRSTARSSPSRRSSRWSTPSPRALATAGVIPAWMLGHSVGEFAAAVIAGVFDLDDASALIVARGRLMQALPAGGGMLAVGLDEAQAADLIAAEPALGLAAVNGPREVVISGDLSALERLRSALTELAVMNKPLAVSHAFHSPLMAPAAAAFGEVAAQFALPRARAADLLDRARPAARVRRADGRRLLGGADHGARAIRRRRRGGTGVRPEPPAGDRATADPRADHLQDRARRRHPGAAPLPRPGGDRGRARRGRRGALPRRPQPRLGLALRARATRPAAAVGLRVLHRAPVLAAGKAAGPGCVRRPHHRPP